MPIYSQDSKTEICDGINGCRGSGEKLEYLEGGDYYESIIDCRQCNGTGRIVKMVFTYELPFNTYQDMLSTIDGDIFEFFRELDKKIETDAYQREAKINKILKENGNEDV